MNNDSSVEYDIDSCEFIFKRMKVGSLDVINKLQALDKFFYHDIEKDKKYMFYVTYVGVFDFKDIHNRIIKTANKAIYSKRPHLLKRGMMESIQSDNAFIIHREEIIDNKSHIEMVGVFFIAQNKNSKKYYLKSGLIDDSCNSCIYFMYVFIRSKYPNMHFRIEDKKMFKFINNLYKVHKALGFVKD